ncbi:MAG: DMT family transporter [Anaerolineae bacterium]|jgi:drug/metabolite transporter (DMT)-like permease|nr:DMT family transporter [Anaerolineae bacterium]
MPSRPPLSALIILALGVLAVSSSAILIRLMQLEGMPSLVIAALRLSIATLILTPLVWLRGRAELRALPSRSWLLITLSGVFLALHFIFWISSLEQTTVLISTVLVVTSPIWVSILEVVFLRARFGRDVVFGLLITLTAGMLIALTGQTEGDGGTGTLGGAVLALLGAITVAVYLVIGRGVRARLSLLPYIWSVYGIGALVVVGVCIVSGVPLTGYSLTAYALVAANAVLSQVIGHSTFNYVVKFVPATTIGVATQLEPVLSAVLAFFVLGEMLLPVQIVIGVQILLGVLLVVLAPPQTARSE